MARVKPLTDSELEKCGDDVQAIQTSRGHPLNNCYRTMARRPKIMRAVNDLAGAVMRDPGTISIELRWMIAHVVSNAAGCRYCTAHTVHNAATRSEISMEKLDALWDFPTSTLFSSAERAALSLALAAGSCPPSVEDTHFSELYKHYTDDSIVEIVAVIAMFGWFNRWNDTVGSDLEGGPLKFKADHAVASGWPAHG